MKNRAVPVGCMLSGRYGSRNGLIRRTENAIRNFVSFLCLLMVYHDFVSYPVDVDVDELSDM
jgi:hypothetical protein